MQGYRRALPLPAKMIRAQASLPKEFSVGAICLCVGNWLKLMKEKAGSTLRSSRAVPHPSTNRALRRLTSEVGRDPVHLTRYGRQRNSYLPLQMPALLGVGDRSGGQGVWQLWVKSRFPES